MSELIWVVIAALGIWSVYVAIKARVCVNELAFKRAVWTTEAMARIDAGLKDEVAKREALEANLAALEAAPIMLNPAFRECLYQWMRERDKMECDPDSILGQMRHGDH